MKDYNYPRKQRQRTLTENVIDAAVDGAVLGAGIGLLSSIFSDDSSSSILDLSNTSDTTFGGGSFGGAGAGAEW